MSLPLHDLVCIDATSTLTQELKAGKLGGKDTYGSSRREAGHRAPALEGYIQVRDVTWWGCDIKKRLPSSVL